jgi:thymidylate synthase
MNTLDKQYTDLLQDILDNGVTKQDRTGTGTLSVFGRQIRHKMSEGFPLITSKKMYFKGIVTELLWFLRGDTNIKYLIDNNCHIWDGDAYKNYCKWFQSQPKDLKEYEGAILPTQEEFISRIKTNDEFANKWGELGPVYGKQWRSWDYWSGLKLGDRVLNDKKSIDQITNLINDLKTNPDSRRMMVSAWNPADLEAAVLPPCHYGFQVYTRELDLEERRDEYFERLDKPQALPRSMDSHEYFDSFNIPTRAISLQWSQRSVDSFLGLPFNIASYGLLLEIIANEVNMVPDELIGNLGDTHLYLNHIEQAKEQIGRELTREERYDLMPSITGHSEGNIAIRKKINNFEGNIPGVSYHEEWLDSFNIPTRTRKPYPLPKLLLKKEVLTNIFSQETIGRDNWNVINVEDFTLENYQSHPSIKAPLSN